MTSGHSFLYSKTYIHYRLVLKSRNKQRNSKHEIHSCWRDKQSRWPPYYKATETRSCSQNVSFVFQYTFPFFCIYMNISGSFTFLHDNYSTLVLFDWHYTVQYIPIYLSFQIYVSTLHCETWKEQHHHH